MKQDLNREVIYRDPTCEVIIEEVDMYSMIGMHVNVPKDVVFNKDMYFHWLDLWVKIQAYLHKDGYEYVVSSCPRDMATDTMIKFWKLFDMVVYEDSDYIYCSKRLGED